MWVYHCNFTLDTSNVSRVRGCELISVHRCNCTLDILNLSHVPSCGLVSVYQCNFTLDISSLSHVPERGLVLVYHCSLILDISSCRYIAWYFKLSHVPGCGLVRCITIVNELPAIACPCMPKELWGSPGFKYCKSLKGIAQRKVVLTSRKAILGRDQRFLAVVLLQWIWATFIHGKCKFLFK